MHQDDGDDDLTLSSTTQAALAEFLAERQQQETAIEAVEKDEPISIDSFPEDWQVPFSLTRFSVVPAREPVSLLARGLY